MNETNPDELMKAIEIFKGRFGIKTPLDMFKLDEIIVELRESSRKSKSKGGRSPRKKK